MAVLVTGGAGYIGSHAIIELLKSDYEVVAIDNFKNSQYDIINRIKEITKKDFIFHKIDLLNVEELDFLFDKYKIDSIMHFAGLKSVNESRDFPLEYYQNNIVSTLNLCEMMKKYNVKKIVFSSSATVYGENEGSPIKESFSLSALNPYGRTKLFTEQILKDLSVSDSSLKVIILRYFNPIGAHESGIIGESPKGTPNNLMPYITQVAIGKEKELEIFGDDYKTTDGTGVRDYIHVSDLVKGHLKALEYLENHQGIEVFNLGTGNGYSVLEIITAFEKSNKVKVPYKVVRRRPGDVAECYADPTKAFKILGWQANKSLEDMCKDSWRWQTKNPGGFL